MREGKRLKGRIDGGSVTCWLEEFNEKEFSQ
jgi:hypothetical protein